MNILETILPNTEFINDYDIFLDLETDGLFPNQNNILVCGIIKKEQSQVKLIQYCFNEDNEKIFLEKISHLLDCKNNIYTFHGTVFEFPFLKYKQKKLLIPKQIPYDKEHDLALTISSFRHILNIPNSKRITLEKYFKIDREEEIDVKEWTTKNNISKDGISNPNSPILRHNKIELLSLLDLKSKFENWLETVGFYFPPLNSFIYLNNYKFSKNIAIIFFSKKNTDCNIPLISFLDGFSISSDEKNVVLKFELLQGVTNEGNNILSPAISPKDYFKKNDLVMTSNIFCLSKRILFHLFCN